MITVTCGYTYKTSDSGANIIGRDMQEIITSIWVKG